jgi:protein SCO1/2
LRILSSVRRAVLLVLAGLALAALGLAAYSLGVLARGEPELHGTEIEQPPSVRDVVLTARGGEQVSLSAYAGSHLIVFFGYTNCPDVCPLTMSRLGSIYRGLDEPRNLSVVMITVDPDRDTPEVVDDYARGFHPAFDGLGGSRELVDAAASRFYIGHREDGHGGVLHGSQVLLVDPGGRFWRVYNDESQHYLQEDLKSLLAGRR